MAAKFQKKRHMIFTTKNVQRAVQEVKNTDHLGVCLGVPDLKRREIRDQFLSVPQQVKAYIDYFMKHDPLASWRAVIVALDDMREKKAADAIRHLAEPITDPTLTIRNLCLVTASVHNWYHLGLYRGGLGVPEAVRNEIRASSAYQTKHKRKEALLLYYLLTIPMASWSSLAGALHYNKEKTALDAVKDFLEDTPAEPSITPENLSTVLESMDDDLWRFFSRYVNIPSSMEIGRRFSTDSECKQALIHCLVSTHPALSWRLMANALYKMGYQYGCDSCHRALACLQQRFPTGRYRSKQFYESEIMKGHIELCIDKVVVYGIAGSGKTSALAAMLGRDPLTIRCSTPLMKRPINVMFVCVDEKTEWKLQTVKQMQNTVAEVMYSRMPKQQAEVQSSASPASPSQQPSHTTPSQSLRPTSEKTSTPEPTRNTTPLSEKADPDKEQSDTEVTLDSLLQSSEVDEEFVSLINSSPPSSEPILRLIQTLVLDSGGQPQFHEVMPIFLNGASEFVYVFKAHESLDARSVIRYFDTEGTLVYEFTASQTNEETLKQCTRSMSSLTAQNTDIPPPRWLFLATHRDMVAVEKLPGVLDTLHKKLKEILLPNFKEQIIFCDNNMEDFIFTMNAAKPAKKDKECAEAIRGCLSGDREGRRVVVKVPLRWHAVYYKLVEVSEGLGKKVLSREQCGKVADSMKIDEGSCEEALNFFNRLNMLFYFPNILADLVFIDPQIVLDKVTELVEESYRMSQGKKVQQVKPKEGEWLKFRDHGQVTEKLLSKFDSHYEAPLFTPKELVALLKGLLVFAELSENVYFMPCLLQMVSSEVVAQHRVSKDKALAVHFPKSGPLMGMFCCTVAYLLSPENAHPCPWEVVKNEAGTPECLNRNVIEFSVSDLAGTVSLVDQFTHFEIHVHTHPKKVAQMWRLAHDAMFAGLKKAGKALGYKSVTPVPAIVCPTHLATPHPATVDKDCVWKCSKVSREFGDVAEDTIPWWSVCNTKAKTETDKTSTRAHTTAELPTATGERPTLPELLHLKVPQQVSANYSTFGILLLNDQTGSRVDAIEDECRGKPERITRKILQEWMEGKGLPLTWESLVQTLRDTGLSTLADQIKASKLHVTQTDSQ